MRAIMPGWGILSFIQALGLATPPAVDMYKFIKPFNKYAISVSVSFYFIFVCIMLFNISNKSGKQPGIYTVLYYQCLLFIPVHNQNVWGSLSNFKEFLFVWEHLSHLLK
jgi:hypothetical protein